MTERIKKLTELTLNGNMYVTPIKTNFDKKDLLLEKTQMEVKRICEYILNQEPKITEFSAMTGFFYLTVPLSAMPSNAVDTVQHKKY